MTEIGQEPAARNSGIGRVLGEMWFGRGLCLLAMAYVGWTTWRAYADRWQAEQLVQLIGHNISLLTLVLILYTGRALLADKLDRVVAAWRSGR